MNNFQKQKKDILFKLDKSSIGKWDAKIISLCEKINSLENYYTTSSCSGRVVLIVDNAKKRPGLFVKVWHDLISFEGLKKSLEKCATRRTPKSLGQRKNIIFKKKDRISSIGLNLNIKFKQEPCILHVACNSLEQSLDFLKKARSVGFKRGGIISGERSKSKDFHVSLVNLGKRFVLELIGTEKLEFPIIENGKILVDDEFLKMIVKKSNENLKKSWNRVVKLKNIL